MRAQSKLVLRELLMATGRRDHTTDQAALPAQLFAVECPVYRAVAESEHGRRQLYRFRILQPYRMYRLVSKLFDRGSGFRQRGNADQERIDLMRRPWTDDMTEAFAVSARVDRGAGLARMHPRLAN